MIKFDGKCYKDPDHLYLAGFSAGRIASMDTCKNISLDKEWTKCDHCGAFTQVINSSGTIQASACGSCGRRVEEADK